MYMMDVATHTVLIVWGTGLAVYAWALCFGDSVNYVSNVYGGDL